MRCRDFMPELFKSMEGHGMKIGNDSARALPELTIFPTRENIRPPDLYEFFQKAKVKARDFFLDRNLKGGKLGLFTNVILVDGTLEPSLVTQGVDSKGHRQSGPLYAILTHPEAPSHWIANANSKTTIFTSTDVTE
jgi:hypothetical protein